MLCSNLNHLNEGYDGDDGVADGEYAPEDANGLGVPHELGRVEVGGLQVLHLVLHGLNTSTSIYQANTVVKRLELFRV